MLVPLCWYSDLDWPGIPLTLFPHFPILLMPYPLIQKCQIDKSSILTVLGYQVMAVECPASLFSPVRLGRLHLKMTFTGYSRLFWTDIRHILLSLVGSFLLGVYPLPSKKKSCWQFLGIFPLILLASIMETSLTVI